MHIPYIQTYTIHKNNFYFKREINLIPIGKVMFLSSHTAEFTVSQEVSVTTLTFLLHLSCHFHTFYLLGSILILLATLSLMLYIKHLAISPCLSSVCKSLASTYCHLRSRPLQKQSLLQQTMSMISKLTKTQTTPLTIG